MSDSFDAEIAIVGGGPAGAALAIRLAGAGREVVVFERRREPQWRACGVFSSPLTRARLRRLGLTNAELARTIRPISALQLESATGRRCRLEYPPPHACGIDRVALDATLLEHAGAAGARVRTGAVVRSISLPWRSRGRQSTDHPSLLVSDPAEAGGTLRAWTARLVIGADGPSSLVARSAGVARRQRWLRKAGITYHVRDVEAAPKSDPMEGHFLFGRGSYVGHAPVPGSRVNVGLVVGESQLREALAEGGGLATATRRLLRVLGPSIGVTGEPTDEPQVALPLAHRVVRTAGAGFLLVGDATGFVDPLTGEGLHRALASSELAARAIEEWAKGNATALAGYDRHLRARFRNKDILSWVLQGFLASSAAFDYALQRIADRDALRRNLTDVLTDRRAASQVIDPRYLASLLRP